MKAGDLIKHVEDNVFGIILKECAHPTWPKSRAIIVQWSDMCGTCTEFKEDENFELVARA